MKISLSAVLLSACLVLLMLCGAALAEDTEYPYTYTVTDGSATITRLDPDYGVSDLIVPDTLGGYPVTAIADGASAANYSYFSSVVIPDSVTSLGYLCLPQSVGTIYLPGGVTQCSQLLSAEKLSTTAFVLSGGSLTAESFCRLHPGAVFTDPDYPGWNFIVDDAGRIAPSGPPSLAEIPDHLILPPFIQSIPDRFCTYTTISAITLPDALEHVGTEAFNPNDFLREVYLPDGISSWGENPFPIDTLLYGKLYSTTGRTFYQANAVCRYGIIDKSLTDPEMQDWGWRLDEDGSLVAARYLGNSSAVTIPDCAEIIGGYLFRGLENYFNNSINVKITSITIPDSVRRIEGYAFQGASCTILSLPSSITQLDQNALSGLWLDWISIPTGVKRIDEPLFDDDSYLYTAVLPAGLTYICSGAFGSSLDTVYCYRGSYAEEWALDGGYEIIYLDGNTLKPELTYMEFGVNVLDNVYLNIGESFTWTEKLYIAPAMPDQRVTLTCKSSNPSVLRVNGTEIESLAEGKSTLTYSIAEYPEYTAKETHYVYKPIQSASFPDTVLMRLGAARKTMYLSDVTPADANPYVKLCSLSYDEFSGEYFPSIGSTYAGGKFAVGVSPADEPGIQPMRICFTANDADEANYVQFDLVTYETLGPLTVTPPARSLYIGELYMPSISLTADDLVLSGRPSLYTLSSSDNSVVRPAAGGMLEPLKEGTAVITVTAAVTGEKKTFSVTVKKNTLLDLPESLAAVADYAFFRTSAVSAVVPDGVTSIGEYAFAENAALESISIPASVVSIADTAFDGCGAITITAPEGSYAQQYALDHGFAFAAQ